MHPPRPRAASLTIWTNVRLPEEAAVQLRGGLGEHRLVYAASLDRLNLTLAAPAVGLADADVAFGQPDATQVIRLPRLR